MFCLPKTAWPPTYTVRAHLRNILEKLHLHNRIQAAA